jgi:hypothetical protein
MSQAWLTGAILSFCIAFQAEFMRAQFESGRVVGTVFDSTGAVVPGADVTVKNVASGIQRQITADGCGQFVVTPLQPGLYTVIVQRTGFKSAQQESFKLDVSQVVDIKIHLEVGAADQVIAVTGTEPLVETQTSLVGTVMEQSPIGNLPLNGRDFIQHAYLIPGVNAGPSGAAQRGGIPENERANGSIQANGLTATNNNFLLNGFDNSEQQIGFEIVQPPVDAIEEFKIQTNGFSADIGKGGAVVNVATKAGTNQFHGSAYDFLRNSYFAAKNYFDSATDPITSFKRNQFGATLGGPIIKNNQNQFDIRLDHQLTAKDSAFVIFDYGVVQATNPDPLPGKAGGGTFTGNIKNRAYAAGISNVHTFVTDKINETKIGYTRYAVEAKSFYMDEDLAAQMDTSGVNYSANTGGLPATFISGYTGLGNQAWFPELLYENNYQALDSFSYIKGHHALKFGVDFQLRRHSMFQTQNPRGDLTFDQQFTENLATIREISNEEDLSANAPQFRLEKRFSHGWSVLNFYTWQHTLGNLAEDESSEPQNMHDLKAERGDSAPDFRRQFG